MVNILQLSVQLLGFLKVLLLGPIIFLIFINDLPYNLLSKVAIFADDTSLYSCHNEKSNLPDRTELSNNLGHDMSSVSNWGSKWLVTFNSKKNYNYSLLIAIEIQLIFPSPCSGKPFPNSSCLRLLGLPLSSDLTWNDYIKSIAQICLYDGWFSLSRSSLPDS